MDPYPSWIPAPPATFPFTLEPNNHIPTAAAAASSPAPNQNHNHPPYDEMIYTAIGALKEKEGSSKRAIGKYIEQVYKDHLPPTQTHSALLTQHLNRLKSNGLLLMLNKSYMLPTSDSLPPVLTPRPRGRPPKPKPHTQAHQPQNAEPVWAALGLADEPAAPTTELKKRAPGRPPKIGGPAVPGRRGRPPKRLGRPPKPKSVSAIPNGFKRRPGRPPKIQSKPTVIPFAAPDPATLAPAVPPVPPAAPVGSPRPRGRPKKNVAALPGVGAPAPPIVAAAARGRGRGRGRPPKLAVVGRPKNPTGRPVGRPKGSTAATTAQKVANEDLRRKLEYFQSKVKESLGVLKPYFNHESPVTAIAAIQELEILATFDLNAPLRDETQQLSQSPHQLQPQQQLPPQQLSPQQLPQLQIYQQQYPQIPPQAQLQQLFQTHASAPS